MLGDEIIIEKDVENLEKKKHQGFTRIFNQFGAKVFLVISELSGLLSNNSSCDHPRTRPV